MLSPTIRPATTADLPALGHLGALLMRQHYQYDPLRFMTPPPGVEASYEEFLASQIGQPEVMLLVAEVAGRVCGYAYGTLEGTDYMALRDPAGLLHDLLVDPEQRGQGIGQQLLAAALAALAAMGAPRVILTTAEGNVAAQRLFARFGFRRTMVEMTREAG